MPSRSFRSFHEEMLADATSGVAALTSLPSGNYRVPLRCVESTTLAGSFDFVTVLKNGSSTRLMFHQHEVIATVEADATFKAMRVISQTRIEVSGSIAFTNGSLVVDAMTNEVNTSDPAQSNVERRVGQFPVMVFHPLAEISFSIADEQQFSHNLVGNFTLMRDAAQRLAIRDDDTNRVVLLEKDTQFAGQYIGSSLEHTMSRHTGRREHTGHQFRLEQLPNECVLTVSKPEGWAQVRVAKEFVPSSVV